MDNVAQQARLEKATTDAAEFKAGYDKAALDAAEYKAGFDKAAADATEFKAGYDKVSCPPAAARTPAALLAFKEGLRAH